MTLPLAVLAGFAPTVAFAMDGYRIDGGKGPNGGIQEALHRITMNLTGYEWKGKYWSMDLMLRGWTPLVAGMLVHKLAGRLGVNRMLSRAGIPLVRV